MKKILAGFFGFVFLAVVSIGFLFVGWTTMSVACSRSAVGSAPNCSLADEHLLGLYALHDEAVGVTGIGKHSSTVQSRSSSAGMVRTRSVAVDSVVFYTPSGDIPLSLFGTGNVNSAEKEQTISLVQGFLDKPEQMTFSARIDFHNIFGYVGLIGMALAAWTLLTMLWRLLVPQKSAV